MVDLEPVESNDDIRHLRSLVEEHVKHTGSNRAQELLKDWEGALRKFVKVMPRDYRRALEEMAARAEKKSKANGTNGHGTQSTEEVTVS